MGRSDHLEGARLKEWPYTVNGIWLLPGADRRDDSGCSQTAFAGEGGVKWLNCVAYFGVNVGKIASLRQKPVFKSSSVAVSRLPFAFVNFNTAFLWVVVSVCCMWMYSGPVVFNIPLCKCSLYPKSNLICDWPMSYYAEDNWCVARFRYYAWKPWQNKATLLFYHFKQPSVHFISVFVICIWCVCFSWELYRNLNCNNLLNVNSLTLPYCCIGYTCCGGEKCFTKYCGVLLFWWGLGMKVKKDQS